MTENFLLEADRVAAIYLIYEADISNLTKSVENALKSVDKVYLFNNSPYIKLPFQLCEKLNIIDSDDNVGVLGVNIVADMAFLEGFSYIVILDQDSLLPINYIERAIKKNKLSGGVISPVYFDKERELLSSVFDYSKIQAKIKIKVNSGYLKSDFSIGSGMLISLSIWYKIKGFREEFMLDCVDIDFCFKLKNLGIPLYIDSSSLMYHSIGQNSIILLGKKISLHSAKRHEIYYRNSIKLIFEKTSPLQWRVKQFFKIIIQFLIYSTLSDRKLDNFMAFFKAILKNKNTL